MFNNKVMSGPTFSPDGNWMWNGTEWIPAPPKEQVLPQSSIDEVEVSNVAAESGVDPEQLTQVAPYFDENKDQILQQSELQQAAMSISNDPNVPVPQQPVVPQQPAMPQQRAAPMAPGVPQQPAIPQQPAAPMVQQYQANQAINVQLLKNRFFPTVKLIVMINDPVAGINEQVSFGTLARTFTSKLANGMVIGKLPLQGITIFSGAQGIITFPNGYSYNVNLNTGLFGMVKGMVITSLVDGRTGMYNF